MSSRSAENRGLAGLRVLSLESRRAEQMAALIRNHGGTPVAAPSMREIPIEENAAALAFAQDLFTGGFDAVIFLTGVGTRILFSAIETKHPREWLVEALSRVPGRGARPEAGRGFAGVQYPHRRHCSRTEYLARHPESSGRSASGILAAGHADRCAGIWGIKQ